MLYALVAPAPRMDTPPAAAPTTNPTSGTVFTIASGATRVTLDQLSQTRGDTTTTVCMVGPGSTPTVHLLFDREGQPMAAYTGGATGGSSRCVRHLAKGWLTVPCDTSDVSRRG